MKTHTSYAQPVSDFTNPVLQNKGQERCYECLDSQHGSVVSSTSGWPCHSDAASVCPSVCRSAVVKREPSGGGTDTWSAGLEQSEGARMNESMKECILRNNWMLYHLSYFCPISTFRLLKSLSLCMKDHPISPLLHQMWKKTLIMKHFWQAWRSNQEISSPGCKWLELPLHGNFKILH